jgi:hypothetical protein
MDTAYLHLITNHIPIIGVPFALALLLIGMWRNSAEVKAAAYLIFAFLAVATLTVYFLGQGGEDFVEELPGVSHDTIEDHEEFAIFGLVGSIITGVVSLAALLMFGGFGLLFRRRNSEPPEDGEAPRRTFPSWINLTVLVLALITAALLGYTGQLGGKIRHPEFHGGVTAATTANQEAGDPEAADADENGSGRGRGRGRGGRE